MKIKFRALMMIIMICNLYIGCAEDDQQTVEQPAVDSAVEDMGVDDRIDAEIRDADIRDADMRDAAISDDMSTADASILDASTADASVMDWGQVDGGESSDIGVRDAQVAEDATLDMGGVSNGSAGCGVGQSPSSGVYEMDVNGTMREYHIVSPEGYDAGRLHKLIFVWHGLGETAARVVERGFFGLRDQNDGSAIFVAGQGLSGSSLLNPDEPGLSGWSNLDGGDVNFARALLAKMRADYCIDNDRVFSTGWSFGGIMTNRLGCELKNELRAIAPVMGQGPEVWNQSDCSRLRTEADCVDGQVAVWLTHGTADTTVPYCTGERSRDYWQAQNGCATESTPIGENGCVEYAECDQGYPVVWCQTELAHRVPPFAAEEIWRFFSHF